MISHNFIALSGYLGGDPEDRSDKVGQPCVVFSLAVNGRKRDPNTEGKFIDIVHWITCTCWNGNAPVALKYLSKGDPVSIHGKISYRTWKSEAGENRSTVECNVAAGGLSLIKPNGNGNGTAAAETVPPVSADDIPF